MRLLFQKHTFVYVIMAGIFCAIVTMVGITLATHAQAASNEPVVAGQHLISLHDNGQDKGILTTASTLRAAFKEANITIDPNDLVEPGLDEALVASQYEVNIYRARPITIIDGAVRQKVLSPYQTARQVAQHADITLHDEDTTTLLANSNIVTDGAGLQLTVTRATPFTLVLYGKSIQAYSQAATVGEMLKQKNITLKSVDTLSVASNTPITAGMTVELWRNGKQVITEDQAIAFPIDQTKDADQPVGYKKVTTPGVDGKKTVSYEVEMKNGLEMSRTEIQSVTTQEPTRQVEVVGAKSRFAPYTGGGSMTEWLQAAGIAESDWGYAQQIIQKESGWNPNATNASSGACGLAQALPCSKVPGNPYDPVDNLKWANAYAHTCVKGRMYCGWAGAYAFWQANRWW